MIKAIIVDYAGVLSNQGSWQPFLKRFCDEKGLDFGKVSEKAHDVWVEAETDKVDDWQFWDNMASLVKEDAQKIRKDILEGFGMNQEMLVTLRHLKGYKLGLLSNQIREWLGKIIGEYKLDELFDAIVTSYDEGIRKPDPRLFTKIAERLGAKLDECLVIDDQEKNTNAAKSLDMKTILFKDMAQMKSELVNMGVKL